MTYRDEPDWHTPDPPRANRTLILACLASAFVVAVLAGAAAKWGGW